MSVGKTRHWTNPWEEALDVPLEEIIRLVSRYNNSPDPAAREASIREWLSQHDKLDAYILPSPSGWHSLGARYGNEGSEYISFPADKGPELEALLAKAQTKEEA